MTKLKSGEIAVRQDIFEGLIDELMDAIGWLSVIQDEFPEVLQQTCGTINAEQRLRQMTAMLSGSTLDKRYDTDSFGGEKTGDQFLDNEGQASPDGEDPARADVHESRPE